MSIYTKKGDKGETGLPGKRRLSKTDPLFEVLGSFDQLSATIGLAASLMDVSSLKEVVRQLHSVQSDLLGLGACLASEQPATAPILKDLDDKISVFEESIDAWEKETGPLQNFILAGGSPAGATLHLARTVARQAERQYHRLKTTDEKISRYLNRLSDFLFQAARAANFREGKAEQIWISPQK